MSTRIPPLLEPYLGLPPEASLLVLTSVLGASTNWLVLRYLHSLLSPSPAPAPSSSSSFDADPPPISVLLISFLRPYAFWRDGAARLGTDLDAAGRQGRLVFVDGLTGLFLPPPPPGETGGGAEPRPPPWQVRLTSARLADVVGVLAGVVEGMRMQDGRGSRVVVVLDQLDVLVAAGLEEGREEGEGFALGVREMVLDLREKTHATIMTLAADEPLVAGQTTRLEREHAALVLSAAHEAETVLALRLLDTGTAKDVSGVVRITRGGGAEPGRAVEEREYLYHVLGDGGVRVFERGQ